VALWALGFVRASVRARTGGCGSGSSLTATATSLDRETVATLTKAITILTEQLKAKDIWAKSQEAELKRFMGGHVSAAPIVPTTPYALRQVHHM
jgi:hypothetical protein